MVLSGGEPGPFATPLQGLNTVKRALCAGCTGMPVEPSVFRKQTAKVNGTFEQVPVGILCSLEPLPFAAPSTDQRKSDSLSIVAFKPGNY